MSADGLWHGRLVDPGGAPVPHGRVVIVGGSVPIPELAIVADAAGRFVLRLPSGRFQLEAFGEANAHGSAVADTTADEPETLIMVGCRGVRRNGEHQ